MRRDGAAVEVILNMRDFLVATVTCPDRTGVVKSITNVIVANGGNWEESRLARLGGHFAGIILVSSPPDKTADLENALQALRSKEMSVTVRRTVDPSQADMGQQSGSGHQSLCRLYLSGADHEGIVHDLSAYLAQQGINVEQMETDVTPAPISATPLFRMTARLKVPSSDLTELQGNLARMGDDLSVDIRVEPEDG